jgi:hypothetical protein
MEYIAFDAHKHYTLASVARPDGQLVREQRLPHERGALQQFLARCEPGSPVAVETIGNWYWIVDEIEAAGCLPKLVHARKAKLMMGEINKTDSARRPSGFPRASCATNATFRERAWCSSASARSSKIVFTPPWPSTLSTTWRSVTSSARGAAPSSASVSSSCRLVLAFLTACFEMS